MSFFFNCTEKTPFFWDPCRNITTRSQCMMGFLCRAIFRVRAEILILGEIYTSAHKSSAYLFTKQTVKAGSNYIGAVPCQVRSGAQAHRRALLTSPGLHRPILPSSVWCTGSCRICFNLKLPRLTLKRSNVK